MEENTSVEETKVVEEKQPKSTKEKTIFGLKIAGNIVFYAIILALLLFSIMNINAGSSNGGFPNIFGHGFLSVQSNSMTRSKTSALPEEYNNYKVGEFAVGDLLYADTITSKKQVEELKVGDVITFFDEDIKNLNSHRIVYISYNPDGSVNSISVQGDLTASIQGVFDPSDSEKTALNYDLQSSGAIRTFSPDDFSAIKGVITGVSYGAGHTVDNIKKNWGWFFVLPIAIVLLVELFFVIKNIIALTSEKQRVALAGDKEKMMADLEAQKEAMRAQILAELKAQEEANNKETTDKVEESDKKEE
jgi:signal peptidase